MRRPVVVKQNLYPSLFIRKVFSAELSPVATLPSALFGERLSLGASWVFSFQSVLPPVRRPWLPSLRREVGPGHLRSHRNSALGFSCTSLSYAATKLVRFVLRNGSYTSPLTHSLCSRTASLRAVAMMARFFPFLPPRSANFSPHRRRSLSAPNGPSMWCAPCTSNVRR